MKHYCLACGNILTSIRLDNRVREMCMQCGWVYYPHRKVSAGSVIEHEGKLLLVRRAIDPWGGCWYLPAGFVEVDETLHQAAERETFEETGFTVKADDLFGVYHFDDDPRGNGILVLYHCKIIGGKFTPNREVSEIAYFAPDAIPTELAGEAHTSAVNSWLDGLYGK